MISSSENSTSDEEEIPEEKNEIREDLKSMTFEEIMKLKEELGAKLYGEAVLGVDIANKIKGKKTSKNFKRLNKNRPREQSANRQVPFLGTKVRSKSTKLENNSRDPRFDERAGEYDVKKFKESYQFINELREKEILHLKRELNHVQGDERVELKKTMQRLINKNLEEKRWHEKQRSLKKEQSEIQKAIAEGRQPHYMTKKERKTKDLVAQFEELKQRGKLNKHLEKRRKKNIAKDRKRIAFD